MGATARRLETGSVNAVTTAAGVRADLIAEQDALDAVVAGLDADQWAIATPSPGWTIADQIGHLTYFDGTAALAITDPEGFTEGLTMLTAATAEAGGMDDPTLAGARSMEPSELLMAWRTNRAVLAEAAASLTDDTRVIWYGPSMGSKSFLTARLMEAWAHGQDIVDAIGGSRSATDRLRHVAQLGYITRGWSYINRGLDVPDVAIAVALDAPDGDTWTFGPDDATETVVGRAEDFCLVVTQRRHVDDTALVVTGDTARDWMLRAQAFAGAPTTGPTPT
jgi:uncharacterized protein (TIGR03084 family)